MAIAGTSSYAALVVGSTGAVGRHVVAQLVASPHCARVLALTRREVPRERWEQTFPALDMTAAESKLEVRPVAFDSLSDRDLRVADDVALNAAFCCLGTTRRDAGSADAFRKVDLEYVRRVGELSIAARVPYFGLVTAANANRNSWFLYPRTKGEVEDCITQLAFARASIFRPCIILRGDLARTGETFISYLFPSISAEAVAKAMVHDFECGDATRKAWSNAEMKVFE